MGGVRGGEGRDLIFNQNSATDLMYVILFFLRKVLNILNIIVSRGHV